MRKAEYVLENETHKILWNFEIQIDHLIPARRPDLVIIIKKERKKRTCRIENFAVLADCKVKIKESEKKCKNTDLSRK